MDVLETLKDEWQCKSQNQSPIPNIKPFGLVAADKCVLSLSLANQVHVVGEEKQYKPPCHTKYRMMANLKPFSTFCYDRQTERWEYTNSAIMRLEENRVI